MLTEISCDRFNENNKVIKLFPGLNTVQGPDSASNSIGKSTFLMIVDFVFGGNDYIDLLDDVQEEVGKHTIKFKFEFNGKPYWFYRSTDNPDCVFKCNDGSYEAADDDRITLNKYMKFLEEQYGLNHPSQTLRNTIGRFIRVYPRDTLNRKKPLSQFRQEKDSQAIESLLKISGLFESINELKDQVSDYSQKLEALRNAQKYHFVATHEDKAEIPSRIEELEKERMLILQEAEFSMLDASTITNDEKLELLGLLAEAKRRKSRLEFNLNAIRRDLQDRLPEKRDDFSSLLRYFPEANIRSLEEIDQFHRKLAGILRNDLRKFEGALLQKLADLNDQIELLEAEIAAASEVSNASRVFFKRYSRMDKELKNLNAILKNEEVAKNLSEEKAEAKGALEQKLQQITGDLVDRINMQMASINDSIFDGEVAAPVFNIEKAEKYTFEVKRDGGSGANYRGVIVFDLTLQKLVNIPVIIHDSDMLKLIDDPTMCRILSLYRKIKDKQVFIAIDKKSSYPESAQRIIQDTTVLKLSADTGALFGRVWNKK